MKALENEIAWSWSRDKIYRRCKREYYWTYYGSWGGWEDDATSTQRKARFLKKLSDVNRLVGDAIHTPIAKALHLRRPAERTPPFEQIAGEAHEAFEHTARLNGWQIGDDIADPKRGMGQLAERYYRLPDLDERISLARVKLEANLDGLRQSLYAKIPFRHDARDLLWVDPVEHPAIMSRNEAMEAKRLTLDDGTVLYGSPDVVVRGTDGLVHIIDWKTGRLSSPDDLQIGAYALFVQRKLDVPPDAMRGHLVHFLAPSEHQVVPIDGLAEKVTLVRSMIDEFLAGLRARLTVPQLNRADDIERFPMIDPGPTCMRCAYRELCGRATLGQPPADSDDEYGDSV
ncbi:hypothetical protein EPN42_08775 [bacterium]|nr:MAG: hypothetical protein EPN42_08775 [bacterium]